MGTATRQKADAASGGRPRKRRRTAAGTDVAVAGAEGSTARTGPLKADQDEEADGNRTDGAPATHSASSSSGTDAKPAKVFQTDSSFGKLGLARWLVESCEKLGMHYPTDIQVMCIPPILAGKSVVGNSKTGSGKTACYCLPLLHELSKDPFGVFALILTPVRELAFQVSENCRALGKNIGVQVGEVVGGREMLTQSKMIAERRHVIVATPGRLACLLRGDAGLMQAFRHLRMFVLDEADRLLTESFEEALSEILAAVPSRRQTLLFSATITKSIETLRAGLAGSAPDGKKDGDLLLLDANPRDEPLELLTQQYIFVPKTVQMCYVHYLLQEHFPNESCIVFVPTIVCCQLLTTMLEILGFTVTGLHSLRTQRQRQICLNKFRAGRCRVLVATDVAGRGLDIPKVGVVINVGLPKSVDDYTHRAGRTARAGRAGLVVSVMSELDVKKVRPIEDRIGRPLQLRPVVEEEAIKLLPRTSKARQKAELMLSEVGFEDRVREYKKAKHSRPKG